jgi:SAM-dependent methyltransferase
MVTAGGKIAALAWTQAGAIRRSVARGALSLRAHPALSAPQTPVAQPSALFSQRQVRRLSGYAHRMARADDRLLRRLADPRIRGLRTWEYGMLLGYLRHRGLKPERALDVGTGDSAFPRYLVASGAVGRITTLDLPQALEEQAADSAARAAASGVEQLVGSMLDIPAPDASFDLVTCISAIEHLDGQPSPAVTRSHQRFLADTTVALGEMARVLRPGGLLYLTTDAYLPERQTTDGWAKFDSGGVIWSAYRFDDIEPTFVETLATAGLRPVAPPELDRRLLVADPGRSTFRGRYFTTFALLGERADAPRLR